MKWETEFSEVRNYASLHGEMAVPGKDEIVLLHYLPGIRP
jgi:hypothetical protein